MQDLNKILKKNDNQFLDSCLNNSTLFFSTLGPEANLKILSLLSVIVRVSVVLKRTVVAGIDVSTTRAEVIFKFM